MDIRKYFLSSNQQLCSEKRVGSESHITAVSNPVSVVQSTEGTPPVMRAVPVIAEEIVNNVVDPSLVGARPSDLGTDAPMQPILLPTSYPKSIIGNTWLVQ